MNSKFSFLLCLLWTSCSLHETKESRGDIKFIPSPAQTNSGEPCLFTDQNGRVYLSWLEQTPNLAILKYASLQNDTWSEPTLIASGDNWFVNWADYPMLIKNNKAWAAHFLDKSGEGKYAYDVRLTISTDSGRNWKDPFVVHDDHKPVEHGFVTLLPYGDNFFVTWLDGRNTVMEAMEGMEHHEGHHGAMSLRAAVLDSSGKKINEWELDNKTCDCCQTSAAMTLQGPVVVYRDRSDDEIRDISIVRFIDGKWTEPLSVHHDNWKITGCPVNGPRVAAIDNQVAVAWFSAATHPARVSVIFSADGGLTFGNRIQVNDESPLGRVDLEMINEKTAMVSWMEGSIIKASIIHQDGNKEPSVMIGNTTESRASGFPQMTKSGNQMIFAWTDEKEKNIRTAVLSLNNNLK